ncbi:MAG TPA: SHOCT domain-containing protein [Gammaproteobacteria bacterium]|nr:SHOCT domain-containing protein [Gammaproteobacteria bacterium]
MNHWTYGGHWFGAWHWVWMGLWWLFLIAVVVAVVWGVVGWRRQWALPPGQARPPEIESPEEILHKRYARGEIEREEYQEKLEVLRRERQR